MIKPRRVLSDDLPNLFKSDLSWIGLGEESLVFDSSEDMHDYLNSSCDCEEPELYQPKGISAMMMLPNTCTKCRRLPRRYKTRG